jgi:hypothetical protein
MGNPRRSLGLLAYLTLSIAITGCAQTPTPSLVMVTQPPPAATPAPPTMTPAPTSAPVLPAFTGMPTSAPPTATALPASALPSPQDVPSPTLPEPPADLLEPPTPLPTATLTPSTPRPTRTPRPTAELAARPEQILGTWQGIGPDAMYHQFSEDGTCRGAFLLSDLDTRPNHTCTYFFQGTDLHMVNVSVHGIPSCKTKEAVYRIQILDEAAIRFVLVRDNCLPRVNTTAVVHQRLAPTPTP